jgi:hypothetical protein
MSETFQFVAERHEYLQNGQRIPSVTQILEAVGLVDYSRIPDTILEHKAEIGTAAHAACHYYDEQDLVLESVAAEVLPYVRAWEAFRRESAFVPRLIEQRGVALLNGMKYGYTLDREGHWQGRDVLLEIKCTAGVELSWGPQLAAYETALRQIDGLRRQRIVVHLRPTGKYTLLTFDQIADYRVFEWALGLETWRRMKGRSNGNATDHNAR